MSKNWSYYREEWLKSTSLHEEDAKWALEALIDAEEELFEIERGLQNKVHLDFSQLLQITL